MGCLVLADRPETSFFVGWYAHTKTRRVCDVRIQPTQENAEDDTGVYFWAMSEAFFLWRLQCHRYLDVANKYHLYPGCLILVAVSRKNTDRHGNGNPKIGRLLLLQILQSDGQSERADFSHTRGGIVITCCLYVSHRTWLGRAPWSRCKFVYHLASNKRLLRSFFFLF